MNYIQGISTALALAAGLLTAAPAGAQHRIEWSTVYGTTETDTGLDLAVGPNGDIWVTGETLGDLGGTNAGEEDVFLSRVSPNGSVDFTRQRGGKDSDSAQGVALVGDNTVFATGYTLSDTIDDKGSIGLIDNLLLRYNTRGTWAQTTRFGSDEGSVTYSVAGNATHLLMAGDTWGPFDGQRYLDNGDAFISKRNSTGGLVWTRFVGSSDEDGALATAFDRAENAYVAGYTLGSFSGFTNAGSEDLFVARFNRSGTRTLLTQIGGSGSEMAEAVAVDSAGSIYLTGYAGGDLNGQINAGGDDAFVMKLNSAGTVLWTRLLGGAGEDDSTGIGVDAAGHVWIGGFTDSALGGRTATRSKYDAFVAEYDSNGLLLGTTFLPLGDGVVRDLEIGPDGSVYVAGSTMRIGMTDDDIFVAKLRSIPEPSSALLLGSAGLGLLLHRFRRK